MQCVHTHTNTQLLEGNSSIYAALLSSPFSNSCSLVCDSGQRSALKHKNTNQLFNFGQLRPNPDSEDKWDSGCRHVERWRWRAKHDILQPDWWVWSPGVTPSDLPARPPPTRFNSLTSHPRATMMSSSPPPDNLLSGLARTRGCVNRQKLHPSAHQICLQVHYSMCLMVAEVY